MYSSIPKNTYPSKYRSDDLEYFTGGYITTPADTEKSLDLPKSVYLTKGNSDEKTFSIRVDLHSKYIEIPLSTAQLKEWFDKIKDEDAIALEQEIAEEREEMTDALWAAQYNHAYCDEDACEVNSETSYKMTCTLTPSTYYHEGECVPSKEKCQYCYKYWCGKCGKGLSNYMVKCCWK
jgi:hypothetical protein